MSRQNNRFDAVRVSSACSSSWDAMSGTSQKKFCGECNKHVYDFSQLSRKEADAIMEASHGNLCARISRTAEGEIITKEPLPILPVRIQSRRTSPVANALLATVLGITPIATSIVSTTVSATTYAPHTSRQNPDLEGGAASISGIVTDSQGAMITGATITLSLNGTEIQKSVTTGEGEYSFQNISSGVYTMTIKSAGFMRVELKEIQLNEGQSLVQDIKLENPQGEALVGVIAMPPSTLRVRYIESPLIIDATVGKSTVAEIDGNSKLIRTELYVNSFLKGFKAKNVIAYYHNIYEGQSPDFREGETVLAFLEPREEGAEGFESSLYDSGVRVLSSTEMQIYSARIRELRDLMHQHKPTPNEIVEWLVRCAQEPVTRWEAAQELLSGFENLEYRLERIEQCKKEGKPIPVLKNETELQNPLTEFEETVRSEPDPDGKFAESLTEIQKNQLAQTLFAARNFSEGDLKLLRLVMKWEREKTIPFAIDLLKQEWTETVDPTYSLLNILEDAFNNEAFAELVSDFQSIKFHEKQELDNENLSDEEKDELIETDKQGHAQQKVILKKIIAAATSLVQKAKN